jgi:DNA polymerase (family 10)
MENRIIAQQLLKMAHSLETERANFYRVKAYRRAAETVLGLDRPVEEMVVVDGRKALRQLPGIGGSMSEKIEKLVRTGDIANLKEEKDTMLIAG